MFTRLATFICFVVPLIRVQSPFWVNKLTIEFLELSHAIFEILMLERPILRVQTETHRPRPPSNNHHSCIWSPRLSSRTGIRYLTNRVKVYHIPHWIVYRSTTFPTVFSSFAMLRQIFIREGIEIVHGHASLSNLVPRRHSPREDDGSECGVHGSFSFRIQ